MRRTAILNQAAAHRCTICRNGVLIGTRKAATNVAVMLLLASTFQLHVAADDFPLKKVGPLTWIVDYEPFWSPDGRQIVLISSRHGGMKVHTLDANSSNHGSDMRQ